MKPRARCLVRLAVIALSITALIGCAARSTPTGGPGPVRLLIVSIDGLGGDLLLKARVPEIRRLMKRGAYTLQARTIDPPYTVPAHVSMLTGVLPETHGVTWNDHIEQAYPEVPTLLQLAHRAGRTTAIAVGKSKLIVFTTPETLNWAHVGDEELERDADIARRAASIMAAHRPEVMFVHLADVDIIGHESGWGSQEQLRAVEEADRAVGQLLEAVEAAGLTRSTVVILTADHGGSGIDHGPDISGSYDVPWIAAGPLIRRNIDIARASTDQVRFTATFAIACELLGLEVPHAIDGHFPRFILVDRAHTRARSLVTRPN